MKKLVIALLAIFTLAGLAAAGAGYYVYRQVRSTVSQFAELGQVPEIERGVRVKGGFVPPASEELTAAQVERFMRVQARVRQTLGQRFAEFERKYRSLSQKDQPSLADAPAVIAAYRELASTWLDAKRSQVAALNDVGLSLDEYRWIRDQAYRALGMPYVDLDFGALAAEVRSGITTEASRLRGSIGEAGPELNRKLIETVRKQLESNLALASFGL
jgi:hypothetical protein